MVSDKKHKRIIEIVMIIRGILLFALIIFMLMLWLPIIQRDGLVKAWHNTALIPIILFFLLLFSPAIFRYLSKHIIVSRIFYALIFSLITSLLIYDQYDQGFFAPPIVKYIKNGDLTSVVQQLEKGVDPNLEFRIHHSNKSLLCYALPDAEVVGVLVKYGANFKKKCVSTTPLYRAVDANEYKLAKLLLDNGANVNVIYGRAGYDTYYKSTPLDLVLNKLSDSATTLKEKKKIQMMEALLRKYNALPSKYVGAKGPLNKAIRELELTIGSLIEIRNIGKKDIQENIEKIIKDDRKVRTEYANYFEIDSLSDDKKMKFAKSTIQSFKTTQAHIIMLMIFAGMEEEATKKLTNFDVSMSTIKKELMNKLDIKELLTIYASEIKNLSQQE